MGTTERSYSHGNQLMLNSTMSDYTELGSLNAIEAKIELNGMLAKDSHVRQWHRDYETPDMKTT